MSDFIGELIVAFIVAILPDRLVKWIAWIVVIIFAVALIAWLTTTTVPPPEPQRHHI